MSLCSSRLKGTQARVFSLHPGCIETNLGRHIQGWGLRCFFAVAKWLPKPLASKTIPQVDGLVGSRGGGLPFLYFLVCSGLMAGSRVKGFFTEPQAGRGVMHTSGRLGYACPSVFVQGAATQVFAATAPELNAFNGEYLDDCR